MLTRTNRSFNRILAIDLGKFKSVACDYHAATGTHAFATVATRPQAMHDLIVERSPDEVVIEVGSQAGWVQDLCESLGVAVRIANPNHEAWRWKNVKRKTDQDDALKLAQLCAMDQLPTIRLPKAKMRQWRSLVSYRWALVGRRTAIKNTIRATLDRQGRTHPGGKSGWTNKALALLQREAQPIGTVPAEALWRGQLDVELRALAQVQVLIDEVESRLEALAASDDRVQRLRPIPGVGPRLAEVVVTGLDDPHRFANGKQVGALSQTSSSA